MATREEKILSNQTKNNTNKFDNIEILAPAGNMESMKAAVFSGADALYMGGSLFSARANAINFTDEELKEAVKFAHVRGVKVYVTVNTLIKDRELFEVMNFVEFLCSISVDGILVQDMGLFYLINKLAPDMPLHCSTQMSLHTKEGVKLMEELGADRAVLSREMSLKEIKEIKDHTSIELEAFVHGALCMSVSGQCYFSAMLGSRSGNRGRCAQTCRLPFQNESGETNVLSLKDMSFIENIKELKEAGVMCGKIEGRMKRPEYVAAAVSACRKGADEEEIPSKLLNNLEAVFSRSGFTDGYLKGDRSDMFGIRTKEDVVSSTSQVFGELHELYKGEAGRVPLMGNITLLCGEKAELTLWDKKGNRSKAVSEKSAEKANNRPMDEERITQLVSKLGGTPYHLEKLKVKTDGISILPASEINNLRRSCIEELNLVREKTEKIPCEKYVLKTKTKLHLTDKLQCRGVFRSFSQIPKNVARLSMVYLPVSESLENFIKLRAMNPNVGVDLPRSFFGGEKEIENKMKALMENGFDTFLCGNIGGVALCKKLGAVPQGSFSLNITNTESLEAFEKIGLKDAEVSFELTLDEISRLGGSVKRGVMAYGLQPLMLVRNCPISLGECKGCDGNQCITDRKGVKFPIKCVGGKTYKSVEILNSVPVTLCDRMREIKNVDFVVLRFYVENSVETGEKIDSVFRQENTDKDYTRGLFYRGIF